MQPGPTDQFGEQPTAYAPAMSQTAAPAGGGAIVVQQGGGGGAGKIIVIVIVIIVLIPILFFVLSAVLYVWANSLAGLDQSDSGTLNYYEATDSPGAISDSAYDDLVTIRLHGDDDLNWAFVSLRLTVGDLTYDCSTWNGEECIISQDGADDDIWESGEIIYLSESGTDICADSGCVVEIFITHNGYTIAGTESVSLI